MAGAGFLATRLLAPLGRRAPVLTASAVIVIGLLTVAGKLMPHDPSAHVHAVPGAHGTAAHAHDHH
jgi:hypothetical protein